MASLGLCVCVSERIPSATAGLGHSAAAFVGFTRRVSDPFCYTAPQDLIRLSSQGRVALWPSKRYALWVVLSACKAVQHQRSPTDSLAFQPYAPHAGAHPFDNQQAFQLGDCADESRQWPGGYSSVVDGLSGKG